MPSSFLESIPKELLEAILDKIEERDYSVKHTRKRCLFQLMLTCKHWSSIAKEAFYNEQFTLDVDTAKKLIADKKTQQLPLKNIEVTYELANHAAFMKLLSMCPDLTNLRVQGRPGNVAPPSAQRSFYTSLYVLSRSHYLSKLRNVEFELQDAAADQLLVHHLQAMLQLKDSLTHLQIVDSTMCVHHHNYRQPSPMFVAWFDHLKEFPRLTTLRINIDSLTYLYEMDQFIEKIGPTVTNVNISMDNTRVLQPLKRINPATIACRSSTKSLNLEMAVIRAEDLNYMMHKFNKLAELKITIIDYGSNVAASLNEDFRSDGDSLKRFFEYLTGLSKYLVKNILVHNSLLRQALVDLKKCFQIKHLTLSNLVPTCAGTTFSIKSLSKARDGHRGQVLLDLEIGTLQLRSAAKLVYEILKEDVEELQFGDGLVEHMYDDYDESESCPVQGEAVKIGINRLPSLKSLTAINPKITSMKSIVNPKAPKLTLDLLELGSFVRLGTYFQMSQRVKHIKSWIAPYFANCEEYMERRNYVLNMPFTTFDEINIDTMFIRRYIVKLSTSSNTTFHGVNFTKDKKLPTERDYYQRDDGFQPNYDNYEGTLDAIGRITIICSDVKRLNVGPVLINMED